MIVYEKEEEWPIVWERMTTSDNNWQWVAANDIGTTNQNDTAHFKEWVTAFWDKDRCITFRYGLLQLNCLNK